MDDITSLMQDSVPDYLGEVAPEPMLLCALMWNRRSAVVDQIMTLLAPSDFAKPVERALFEQIRDAHAEGRPYDPASLHSAVERAGDELGVAGDALRDALRGLVTLGADPLFAADYAAQIISQSYRRQFRAMTERLAMVADVAPESDLFDKLVEEGSRQRTAWNRLRQVNERLRGIPAQPETE